MKENKPNIFSERGELGKFGFLMLLVLVVVLVTTIVNAINIKSDLGDLSDIFKSVIKQSKLYDTDANIRERLSHAIGKKDLPVKASDVVITRRNNMLNLKMDYEAEFIFPFLPVTPTFKYVVEENTSTAASQ